MKVAIKEHLKCTEYPRVGAVISKEGVILSTGFRGEKSGIHAERIAIEKLSSEELNDSILFTTLEPCIRVHNAQSIESCSELIIKSGIKETIIGILDPNGTVYSEGYKKLLENNIRVTFFNKNLRVAIEEKSFEYGKIDKIVGHGKRRIPVVQSGISIDIQFAENDTRTIKIRWSTLQFHHGCVDLLGQNGSIRAAAGASKFSDITEPMIFRFQSHFARMKKGEIAIVKPSDASFCVLIKLLEIYENDILFQWEVRND